MQGSISLLVQNVVASATLPTARAVSFAGALSAAAAAIYGVTRTSGVSGDLVPIDCVGTTLMEAGAAITAGVAVEVEATGRAVPFAAGVKVGRALTGATGAGLLVEVLLFPGA